MLSQRGCTDLFECVKREQALGWVLLSNFENRRKEQVQVPNCDVSFVVSQKEQPIATVPHSPAANAAAVLISSSSAEKW